jgi:phosphopantothenate synthetase
MTARLTQVRSGFRLPDLAGSDRGAGLTATGAAAIVVDTLDVARTEDDALIAAIDRVRRRHRWIIAGLGAVMIAFAALAAA